MGIQLKQDGAALSCLMSDGIERDIYFNFFYNPVGDHHRTGNDRLCEILEKIEALIRTQMENIPLNSFNVERMSNIIYNQIKSFSININMEIHSFSMTLSGC